MKSHLTTMTRNSTTLLVITMLITLVLFGCTNNPGNDGIALENGFKAPPESAKPRVWWHWMNGNITRTGIRADLEWMHRVGIAGFQNFDASLMTPQVVEKRLVYMTPEWKDAFHFATRLADSLGLEMAIAGSPGWSESGGPWVKPEDGMKKIVWSETRIQGGQTFNGKLPDPPDVTGPFQNIPRGGSLSLAGQPTSIPQNFYRDIAVIAYKLPPSDISLKELNPIITSSGGRFSLDQLTDGDVATTNLLPSDQKKGFAWIGFAFDHPQTIKAITIVGGGDRGPFGLSGELKDTRSLEASEDGEIFHPVCFIPAGNTLEQSITVPLTTAKFFRVTFKNPPAPFGLGALFGFNGPKPPEGTEIAEIVLHPVLHINRFEEKAAFAPAADLYKVSTPATNDTISSGDVINLTGQMGSDGSLNWNAPAGKWNIMRFGYSLLGTTNSPASSEATGLEVDKLDPIAVKNYFITYLDQYKDATKGLMGIKGGLKFMITDSWEAGAQNWTSNMIQEFEKRRGYSMINWMPALTGHIVKSSEASEKFLWDFRRTLGDMVAEYHYDQLTDILQSYGMSRYSESHESGRAFIGDGMDVKRRAAVPMSAMWVPDVMNGGVSTGYEADIRESASVSHIYGQKFVAAESLTAFGLGGNAWSYCPENLKPTADLELASGLNRFVIHTSVHQPLNDKIPGLSLGPFGQWFTRHETWAEIAEPWLSYLSASSYMLQQGQFVADIVYFYGEDNNITALFGKKLPEIPQGYNYDFVNADGLIKLLTVNNGKLVTPNGMEYRVLVLDSNARQMSLPVLRKIRDLVMEGAVITGAKPARTPSLSDNPEEFKEIVNKLWANENGENAVGKGKIYGGKTLQEVLNIMKITPDFTFTKPEDNTNLLFVHRKLNDIDIYWVDNRNNRSETLEASFRVNGKAPELWHADNGVIEPASYTISKGLTTLPLVLDPHDAVFVVFRKKAGKSSLTVARPVETVLATIQGPWIIKFQPERGAPEQITLDSLSAWDQNTNPGVKYFSGTGTYNKNMNFSEEWLTPGNELWLDLGKVKNLADVSINGKSIGIIWKPPFRINITNAVKKGANTLEIKVTNLWVNRLIGDLQPGVRNKFTYTTMPFYKADSPLQPSGLLGPVQIIATTVK
jgi:hypothetical protein